jgi:hypothetical protein
MRDDELLKLGLGILRAHRDSSMAVWMSSTAGVCVVVTSICPVTAAADQRRAPLFREGDRGVEVA